MEQKRFASKKFSHSYAYLEWSTKKEHAAEHKVFMCVHGLSRSSRDFDTIAKKIVEESEKRNESCKVISVDIIGRGKSDWVQDSKLYGYPTYAADMKDFIEHICEENKVPKIYFIGTSMGGILSMFLFATGAGPHIKKLVINDVGAILPKIALNHIKENVGGSLNGLKFATLKDAENYFRKVSGAFGKLTDEQWAHMASYSTVQTEDGSYRMHFDPKIFDTFNYVEKDVELWEIYNAIDVPTLLLHGVDSILLTNETIEKMEKQGPGAKHLLQVVHFQNCGHAPALQEDVQCNAIINFFYN